MGNTNDIYLNRDVRTANDVDAMAKLGRFEEEFVVYGAAVQMEHDILYHVTSDELALRRQMQLSSCKGVYFTPVVSLQKRSVVPSGKKNDLLTATKYTLLSKMKREYESVHYFDLMQPLFKTEANNSSYPILNNYRREIDGKYDDSELQLFAGLLQRAYLGKVLRYESYCELQRWYHYIQRQMEETPVAEDNIGRTLYGFVCWDANKRECVIDASELNIIHQYERKLVQGYLTAPIVKKTYWFQHFGQMKEKRLEFRNWVEAVQNEKIMQMLYEIRQLPGEIDSQEIAHIQELVAASELASYAVQYYNVLWNKSKLQNCV